LVERTPLHTINHRSRHRTGSSTGGNGENCCGRSGRSPSCLHRVSRRAEVWHGRIRHSTRLGPQPGSPQSSSRQTRIGRSSSHAPVFGYFSPCLGRSRELCSSGGRTRSLSRSLFGKESRRWRISRVYGCSDAQLRAVASLIGPCKPTSLNQLSTKPGGRRLPAFYLRQSVGPHYQ
jgi:hypothetical protein